MSLFGNLVSGAIGAGIAAIVTDFIDQHGGLQAIASKFEEQGMGATVQSWISNDRNEPISAGQMQQVLGTHLAPLADTLGMTSAELSEKMAEHLPQVIDRLTPNGTLP